MDTTQLLAIAAVVGPFISGGVVTAWFKLGPERRKLTIETAEGAVLVHSNVLKDLKSDYDRLGSELGQVKMEGMEQEKENEECRRKILRLETSIMLLQQQSNIQGRTVELARRRSHAAINALGSYELHIDGLLDVMREKRIDITPAMRPRILREAFQAEMQKIDEWENLTLEQAATTDTKNASV